MTKTKNASTLKDIARSLGMSHSTVSRSLRDSPLISAETKKRVRKAAEDLGYVAHGAARSLRGGASSLIGLVLPDVRPDFFSALTTTFASAAAQRGLNLLLSVSQYDARLEEAQIRALREARVSGILLYPTLALTSGSKALLSGVPTVQVARKHPDLSVPFVGPEDTESMATLVTHLVSLGHRRIAYIGSERELAPGRERLQAFLATLRALQHPADLDLVAIGAATVEGGEECAARILSFSRRPTALVVASSPMAEGALDVIQRMKLLLPQDLSFTGFGDPFWYRSWGPGITSVALPIKTIVDAALIQLFDVAQPAPVTLLHSQVILRGTTGPPADGHSK